MTEIQQNPWIIKKIPQNPWDAFAHARDIRGADIEKCQEVALRDSYIAYHFARNIPKANIKKCQEAACKNPQSAMWFALHIHGANIEKCIKACKGTEFEGMLNRCLMDKALL